MKACDIFYFICCLQNKTYISTKFTFEMSIPDTLIMYQMIMYNVRGAAHVHKPRENYQLNLMLPLAFTELYRPIELIV